MAEGVQSRRGRRFGRQCQGQFRVEKGNIGIEVGAVHPLLLFQVRTDEHGREGHFAAGPRGCGDHDHGQAGPGHLVQAEVIHGMALISGHGSHRLGQVHGAAPANSHYQIALPLQGDPGTLVGQIQFRLRVGLVEEADLQAALAENFFNFFLESGRGQILVQHHEGSAAFQCLDVLGQLCEGTGSKDNPPGAGKGERFDHDCSLEIFACL